MGSLIINGWIAAVMRRVGMALLFWLAVSASAASQTARDACAVGDDYSRIVAACTEVLKSDPDNVEALIGRAIGHIYLGATPLGAIDARRALELRPDLALAHTLIGIDHARSGRTEEAEAAFGAALAIEPDSTTYNYRGQMRQQLERYEEAYADYSEAVALEPDNADALARRALLGNVQADSRDEAAELLQAIAVSPDRIDLHLALASHYVGENDYEAAVESVEGARRLDPGNPEMLLLGGRSLLAMGRQVEAEADIRKLLAGGSDSVEARQIISWIERTRPLSPPPGDCKAIGAGAAVTVSVDAGQARVGETVSIDWSAKLGATAPTYLVLTMPEAVRLEGTGFIALAPGARGPFGMAFGADRMRAIVPLHTATARDGGSIGILPYRAGPFALEWSVVEIDGCGERVLPGEDNSRTLSIAPGKPELVARDEFGTAQPEAEIRALNAPYRLAVYPDFVEVFDDRTGQSLLRTAGSDPVFSPTGRFLVVESAEEHVYDIFDLVAERRVGRYPSLAFYWTHEDSLLFLGREFEGHLTIVRTLMGKRASFGEPPPAVSVVPESIESNVNDAGGTDLVRNPRPIDLAADDIDVGPGWYSYATATSAWAFDLSIEAGIIALTKMSAVGEDTTEAEKARMGPGVYDALIARAKTGALVRDGWIIDLTLAGPGKFFWDDQQIAPALKQLYRIESVDFSGWNPRGAIWQTRHVSDDGFYDFEQLQPVSPKTQRRIDASPIPVAALPDGETVLRGAVPIGLASLSRDAVSTIAGAQLNHLPASRLEAMRSGVDNARLTPVAEALRKLLAPELAVIGETSHTSYATDPFPDPANPPEEPAKIDVTKPGRDTWVWSSGGERFFLTQTSDASRMTYSFHFTLLAETRNGLKHADLGALASAAFGNIAGTGSFDFIGRGDFRGNMEDAFAAASAVSVAGNRYLMLATSPIPRLIAFDLKDWKVVCAIALPTNPGGIAELALHADLRHITQINKSGQVEIYSCEDGRGVLSGLYVDGELVVVDKNGFYDGSDDAAAYVALKLPGLPGRHLLSQFADRLRLPGLAETVLGGKSLDRAPVVFDPPTVTAALVGEGEATALSIGFRGVDGVRAIEIIANGRLLRQLDVPEGEHSVELPVRDLGESGAVTVLARDRSGLVSAPSEVVVPDLGTARTRDLYGLSVGIDAYPGMPGSDLRFAGADAARLSSAIGKAGSYANVEQRTLIDGQATGEAILSSLETMVTKATADDTIVVSFAGHGLSDGKGGLRVALSSTRLDAVEATSLDFNDVVRLLKRSKARTVVLLDVCHAGLAGDTRATNDEAVNALTTETGAGIVILSASKGRQFSEETAALNGGRFSVAIERALTGGREAADRNGDGRISVNELYRVVKADVANGSHGRQTPWIARNQIFGDFTLF